MYALTQYNYELPAELIAQQPAERRDESRLMVMSRQSGELHHQRFHALAGFLIPGDVLVINNTAVIPGRLVGKKESGGKVEVLICNFNSDKQPLVSDMKPVYECLIKAAKSPREGSSLYFDEQLTARVLERRNGAYLVEFDADDDFESVLDRIGRVPLPPYIHRSEEAQPPCNDRVTYQTIYATEKGAIAAPTAGLHFTPELLAGLKNKGVAVAAITLHVGYGTFRPVRSQDIRSHRMHAEHYTVSNEAAGLINAARSEGHRVIAVGTTCVRTLEYAADASGKVTAGSGDCDLFIYPGYTFKAVDGLITNFHLPQSTLIMLVSAFAGREKVLQAYQEAIDRKYRFYSYGDAMLII